MSSDESASLLPSTSSPKSNILNGVDGSTMIKTELGDSAIKNTKSDQNAKGRVKNQSQINVRLIIPENRYIFRAYN